MRAHCTLVGIAVLFALSADASDRVTVTVPPPGQEVADRLAASLASACNTGDFIRFLAHFTPSHSQKIRERMEDIFIRHKPKIDIQRVTLLSEENGMLTFGVKYALLNEDAPEGVFASKVTARLIDGQWKIDGESVKLAEAGCTEFTRKPPTTHTAVVPSRLNPSDQPARMIDPALQHLRGDIGIQPGRGCANGRCGVR